MRKSTHADYDANPDHQWAGGDLRPLLRALTMDLIAGQERSWRVLRGGAVVSLTREDGKRILRIARSAAPRDDTRARMFEQEVAVFARVWGIKDWVCVKDADAKGIAVKLIEP